MNLKKQQKFADYMTEKLSQKGYINYKFIISYSINGLEEIRIIRSSPNLLDRDITNYFKKDLFKLPLSNKDYNIENLCNAINEYEELTNKNKEKIENYFIEKNLEDILCKSRVKILESKVLELETLINNIKNKL